MADMKYTQVEWNNFFREWMQYMRPLRILVSIHDRLTRARIRVVEEFDVNSYTSNWSFSGALRGINCTEGGLLYVKVDDNTPIAGQATIECYKDSGLGAGDLVSTGQGWDGETIPLVESNDSGLTGGVTIGNPISSSVSNIVLALDIDEYLKANRAFALDALGQQELSAFFNQIADTALTIAGSISTLKSNIESNFLVFRMSEFLKTTTTSIYSTSESTDSNGDAEVTPLGLLAEFNDAMRDETTAGAQSVLKSIPTISAAEFDADNVGSGVFTPANVSWYGVTGLPGWENCIIGRTNFVCNSGKENSLEETFKVTSKLTNGQNISSTLTLAISKAWLSQPTGFQGTLTRTITDVDAGAQVTSYVVVGETLDNTDAGVIYQNLTSADAGTTLVLDWYSDTARSVKVSTGTRTGNGVITMSEVDSSGLSGSADCTYASDDITMSVLLNPFAEGDSFFIDTDNDNAGQIQDLMRMVWNFPLRSAAVPTIVDGFISEGLDSLSS